MEADRILNEADTCRRYVVPGLLQAGWDEPPRSVVEQRTFTDGRILVAGTKPMRYEEFAGCLEWWKDREENERAWKMSAEEILANGCNLDVKNPLSKEELEHLPPEELVDNILAKETRIVEIMAEIKGSLGVER